MSKNKNILIPKLRFPEFVDCGEWVEKPLAKVCKYQNGKAHEKDIDINGKYIVVNSKFISSEGETFKFSNSAFCLAKEGDILMVLSDVPNGKAIAKCFYVKEDNRYTVNQRICKITPRNINGNLLFYLLNRNSYFLKFDDGVKQTNLKREDVLNCPIFISEEPQEQKKIASCLSSLDELIEVHSQKLELLKQHKKGLMQNLFPQEGEKVPKLRFKEFENCAEWEEKTLEKVATFCKGKGISKSDIIETGILPCIRYGELYTHYKEIISEIISYTNIPADNLVLSQVNDVIIPSSGETQDDIATASCVMKDGVALGGDLNIIRTKVNGIFLAYYLNCAKKKDISQVAQGISVVHLYSSQLKKLIINIPRLKEQQKIASCLSSLDDLITAQTEKIEQLNQHKKGLMQGLFPKIND